MKNILCLLLPVGLALPARAQDSTAHFSIGATALLTQNFCTDRTALFSGSGDGFYFHPQLGGIGEVTFAYRPARTRIMLESGLGVWLWGYKIGLASDAALGLGYFNRAGQSASGVFVPVRVGYAFSDFLDVKAGVLFVNHLESASIRGFGFGGTNGTVAIDGEAIAYGRTYTTVAADLSLGFRISRRFGAVLRGTVDTKPFPSIQMQYTVTEGGTARTYRLDGGPRMAFLSVGASYAIMR